MVKANISDAYVDNRWSAIRYKVKKRQLSRPETRSTELRASNSQITHQIISTGKAINSMSSSTDSSVKGLFQQHLEKLKDLNSKEKKVEKSSTSNAPIAEVKAHTSMPNEKKGNLEKKQGIMSAFFKVKADPKEHTNIPSTDISKSEEKKSNESGTTNLSSTSNNQRQQNETQKKHQSKVYIYEKNSSSDEESESDFSQRYSMEEENLQERKAYKVEQVEVKKKKPAQEQLKSKGNLETMLEAENNSRDKNGEEGAIEPDEEISERKRKEKTSIGNSDNRNKGLKLIKRKRNIIESSSESEEESSEHKKREINNESNSDTENDEGKYILANRKIDKKDKVRKASKKNDSRDIRKSKSISGAAKKIGKIANTRPEDIQSITLDSMNVPMSRPSKMRTIKKSTQRLDEKGYLVLEDVLVEEPVSSDENDSYHKNPNLTNTNHLSKPTHSSKEETISKEEKKPTHHQQSITNFFTAMTKKRN